MDSIDERVAITDIVRILNRYGVQANASPIATNILGEIYKHLADRATTASEPTPRRRARTMSEKQYGWRDAIGVLAGHFPDGMMSEEILWCDRNGMDYEEYAHIKSQGVNPRDFGSTIDAYRAYLWQRADGPEFLRVIDAVCSIHGMTVREAERLIDDILTALLGPRTGEEAEHGQ